MRTPIRFLLLALFALSAHAESLDANTENAVRDCTFEVISTLRDPRGRVIVSIGGNAYCLGDGTVATAAHVFDPALSGHFDALELRDRKGRAHAIDRVLRYSVPDDFVVFTAIGLDTPRTPPSNNSGTVTDRLFVARIQGEHYLVTDAQFQGRTSDATYAHAGWIKFSPSPGHGSSGGGLLDAKGRLVGIIRSQSSERADAIAIAIPVAYIESTSTSEGMLGMAESMKNLLDMPSRLDEGPGGKVSLPAEYPLFARAVMQARDTYFSDAIPLALSQEGTQAPLSDGQRRALCAALGGDYCGGAGGKLTAVARLEAPSATRCTLAWSGVGVAFVRCPTRNGQAAESKAIARARDELRRQHAACAEADRLGRPVDLDSFVDGTGAQWSIRAWPTGGCESMVVAMARATAEGMLSFVRGVPSGYRDQAVMQLKALVNLQCTSCESDMSVADHPRAGNRALMPKNHTVLHTSAASNYKPLQMRIARN